MSPRTQSLLFRHIEDLHGNAPWGRFLDAGTGTNSIRWVTSLKTDTWTAVTGAAGHAVQVRDASETQRRPSDRIVLGNWEDPEFLKGEVYDTLLADYLLGAVEGFAPYFQPYLFARLRPMVGRNLYITGLEPYVNMPARSPAAQMVREIGRHRDACLLLTEDAPYREYPADWVIDHLKRSGFRVTHLKHFPIRYGERFVHSQIDMCLPRLGKMPDQVLAQTLRARGEVLRTKALQMIETDGSLHTGYDYVIAACPDNMSQ